jgi:COG2043 family uncharacterized protein
MIQMIDHHRAPVARGGNLYGQGAQKYVLEVTGRFLRNTELPIAFYYTDLENGEEHVPRPAAHVCMIGVLAKVRKGTSVRFDVDAIGCNGGKRYTGFADTISPTFKYFLSCGTPRKIEGERYKTSPDIVKEMMKIVPQYRAPARFLVFKRFDAL